MVDTCLQYLNKSEKDAVKGMSRDDMLSYLKDASDTISRDKANNVRQAIKHVELENFISDYMERWESNYVDNTFAGDVTGKLTGNDLKARARESALNAYIATDRWELARKVSLQDNIAGIRQNYQSKAYVIMEELMPTKAGFDLKRKANGEFIDALIDGSNAKPIYKKMVDTWRRISNDLLDRFNRAGGDIKTRKDWDIPVDHDAHLIGKIGKDEWINDMVRLNDLNIIGIDEAEFRVMASQSYDNITTDGVVSFELPGEQFKSKLANKHQQSRFFKFKDAASWKEYHAKYSSSTPYDIMMDYINGMSQEIGLMESLGPNPDRLIRSATKSGSHADKMYANIAGHTSARNLKMADVADGIRNVTTGIKLPKAMVTAVADMPLGFITEAYNGLPAFGTIKAVIGDIFSGGKANRKLAADIMAQIDFMIDSTHSAARYADIRGHKGTKHFANSVMKVSLLDAWTYTQKSGFHRSFMSALAGDIPSNPHLMRMLDRYGFTDVDINLMMKAKKVKAKGALFLDPRDLPEGLSERLAGAIQAETRYAVVEGDAYTRAFMNQGTKKGTIEGESLRFAGQFKMFPASVITNHWMRAVRGSNGSIGGRAAYMANLAIGAWFAGTIVVQLKEILEGREPIAWDNPELWKKGFVQGGAGSLLVDAMASDSRGYGQSMQEFLMGPSASIATDILWKGMLGSLDDMRKGERDFQDYVKGAERKALKYVPYQMWYTKAAMDEAFLDELRRMTDDNYDAKERARERKRYKELGNKRWIK